jgi:hypothetical protein
MTYRPPSNPAFRGAPIPDLSYNASSEQLQARVGIIGFCIRRPRSKLRARASVAVALLALALALIVVTVAAAPSLAMARAPSPWPSMRHDRHNTGAGTIPAEYHGDRPWSFTTGRGLFITPVIGGDGTVYFGSADHSFYALAADGRLRWRFTTGNIIDAAAALDRSQRTVTIGSGDQNLYRLSTDPRPLSRRRRVIWRYRATLEPAGGQLVDWWEGDVAVGPGGNLFTGNTGGVAYSFTPAGRLRWTLPPATRSGLARCWCSSAPTGSAGPPSRPRRSPGSMRAARATRTWSACSPTVCSASSAWTWSCDAGRSPPTRRWATPAY